MDYLEEEFLDLSGLQHFAFCRRQWALIHIEQQWSENLRTVEGMLLHAKAHDAFAPEKRGDVVICRGLRVHSRQLGVSGACDVVELHASPQGVSIFGHDGRYLPTIVEYKRGAPKENDADRLQLCCQAMCLEEMLGCRLEQACLFYGETKHRTGVSLTAELRDTVYSMLLEMHDLYRRRVTPRPKRSKSCNACSLKELCLPVLERQSSAVDYIEAHLREETT